MTGRDRPQRVALEWAAAGLLAPTANGMMLARFRPAGGGVVSAVVSAA